MVRQCPVCGNDDWALLTECLLSLGHCRQCDMVYAREIADVPDYVDGSIYALPQAGGSGDTPQERARHLETAKTIAAWFPAGRRANVLDIGCAQGGLAQALAGLDCHPAVAGIDPSPVCVDAARRKGFNAWQDSLPLTKPSETRFDVVVLAHVVEHLWAPLEALRSLPSYGSRVYVEVPDISRLYRMELFEPFLEFSAEHVNLFGIAQLVRLAARAELTLLGCGEKLIRVSPADKRPEMWAPTMWAMFECRCSLPASVRQYIKNSEVLADRMDARLQEKLKGYSEAVVWGAGGLWHKLGCWPVWKRVTVKALVDRNSKLHGSEVCGSVVHDPLSVKSLPDSIPIVIASTLQVDSIKADIQGMGLRNPIITLE